MKKRKEEIEFGTESVGDEGKIQIKNFDMKPVPKPVGRLGASTQSRVAGRVVILWSRELEKEHD